MKKLIALLVVCGFPAYAGDLNVLKLSLSNISTNGTNDTVSSTRTINGFIDSVYIDVPSVWTTSVSIVSVAGSGVPAKTIFTHTNMTTDAWYPISALTYYVTANTPTVSTVDAVPISILQQKIQLGAQSLGGLATNSITAYILYRKD